MQKLFWFFLPFSLLLLAACHSRPSAPAPVATPVDSVNIFPVTSFIKAQLRELDTMPVTPLRVISKNGSKDSTWLKREDIRKYASAFLSPEIDSAHMQTQYTESSFLDQTINAYTFSYDLKSASQDSVQLTHWNVYMDPQTNTVQRIYLEKQRDSGNTSVSRQLTWLVNKWYGIRTIIQRPNQPADITEEKMIWDFGK